jgi:hypothetical protein
MRSFAKSDLLLLDDWGLMGLDAEARRDLLELPASLSVSRLDGQEAHLNLYMTTLPNKWAMSTSDIVSAAVMSPRCQGS